MSIIDAFGIMLVNIYRVCIRGFGGESNASNALEVFWSVGLRWDCGGLVVFLEKYIDIVGDMWYIMVNGVSFCCFSYCKIRKTETFQGTGGHLVGGFLFSVNEFSSITEKQDSNRSLSGKNVLLIAATVSKMFFICHNQ